ncbi:MAG: hypothetical protein IKF17_00210 [Clostridia bacterium]|nr:hypothetical protein [Clostridia bacterium]
MNNMFMDKSEEYLRELQKFFDLADNITDKKLKKSIVYQMLKLEKLLKK